MEEIKKSSRENRQYGGNGSYGYANNYGPTGANGYGPPGYRSSGYGHGYGYGGYGDTAVQRSLQDYVLILRERIWFIVIAFVAVFGLTALYTFSRTPLYQSSATVEVFRKTPTVMQGQQIVDSDVRSMEDLNTQVNALKSTSIIDRVAGRLKDDDLKRFLAPYVSAKNPNPVVTTLLLRNREIVPVRLSLDISVNYRHPDRAVAAQVANLFAEEYIAYSSRVRVEESMKAVEGFQDIATEQRKKVNQISSELQAYRENHNLVSLDQRKDINTEKLKELSSHVTQNAAILQEAETRLKQVMTAKANAADLLTLPFIASEPTVNQLQQDVAAADIRVKALGLKYRAGWPEMQEATKALEEAKKQLERAIQTTTAQVESTYETARQNLEKSQAALEDQERQSFTLDRFGVEYTKMELEFNVNNRILEDTLARMRATTMTGSVETQNARQLDRAVPGLKPISPNIPLNLGVGLIGGLGFGLALAFLVAFVDDRIKSTYDIEVIVGLSLLSIIPKFQKSTRGEQTTNSFTAPAEREVIEAFSTLYSGLKVKESEKRVQCIVVTSTIPGEGKSFITRNLALSFASHGERVILVDCDLRRPVVHRAFEMENLKGVIDLCTGTAKLDDVIVRDVHANMDVLPSGGRSKNPAQNLSSKNFEILLSELRKRYDRILIDTPPVALVSDALVILPLADGSIYSIFFNKVRRKAAQFCVQRMLEVNVTHFGAVLNGLDTNLGGYYYHHYYDKKYKGYYAAVEDGPAGKAGGGGAS